MWKTVDKVLSRATATMTISSLNLCGKKISGDRCTAEVANHHFTTVGSQLVAQNKTAPPDDPLKNSSNEPQQEINSSQLVINSNLPTKLVKDAAEYISLPYVKYLILH